MAKDNGEEPPEDVVEHLEEWTDDLPEDIPEEPESPELVDHSMETIEKGAPEGVTFVRQPNGKLIPYKVGMDPR